MLVGTSQSERLPLKIRDSSTSVYIDCKLQPLANLYHYIQIFTTNKHLPWHFYHDIRKNDDYKKK